ncbi:MAG TPA: hypothetical protein VG895_03690 [Patescibacteria group bacterium]|nr:hypothetical protein [Patescibacteria group bacterium]
MEKIFAVFFLFLFLILSKNFSVFAQTVNDTVNVDFSQQIATGYSSIFGVTQTPDDANSMSILQNDGVTFVRQDLSLDTFVTSADPNTWDKGSENYIANKFLQAKAHNMKTMMIIDYTPIWLSFNGQTNGVPNNWTTWESIVKNTLTYFKSQNALPDYYEIWNEPGDAYQDQFFDVTNSGMTKNQAYDLLYLHSWNAIKAVDTNGKIGGPADYQPDSAVTNITYM